MIYTVLAVVVMITSLIVYAIGVIQGTQKERRRNYAERLDNVLRANNIIRRAGDKFDKLHSKK